MNQFVIECLAILQKTPEVVRLQLADLPDYLIQKNYGESTFSPFDIVGHFVHGEKTDWIPRAAIILKHGIERPFDTFDRYAQFHDSKGKTIDDLLDEFQQLRRQRINDLREMDLDDSDLAKKGMHPELGEVTLRNLLGAWTAHDLHHIGQIARSMAMQYADDVGLWRAYMGILRPPAL